MRKHLRRDQWRRFHFLTEAVGLRDRLFPLGRGGRPFELLRPAAKQARPGPTTLRAALTIQAGGGTRARLADLWLVARGNFPLGVIIRPVGKGGRGPEASSSSSSSSFGVGLHRRGPQVRVVDVALRSVGDELTGRARGAG